VPHETCFSYVAAFRSVDAVHMTDTFTVLGILAI
jgi:hypothetical protein